MARHTSERMHRSLSVNKISQKSFMAQPYHFLVFILKLLPFSFFHFHSFYTLSVPSHTEISSFILMPLSV